MGVYVCSIRPGWRDPSMVCCKCMQNYVIFANLYLHYNALSNYSESWANGLDNALLIFTCVGPKIRNLFSKLQIDFDHNTLILYPSKITISKHFVKSTIVFIIFQSRCLIFIPLILSNKWKGLIEKNRKEVITCKLYWPR